MIIEPSVNDKYMETLNLGSFPERVLEFQQSQDFFQQVVFIDYQLQLLIQNEFNGKDIVQIHMTEQEDIGSSQDKLHSLMDYANSIGMNYSTQTYAESMYYSVVLGHLYYLSGSPDNMRRVLGSVSSSHAGEPETRAEEELVEYLKCRYNTLLGLCDTEDFYQTWNSFLLGHSRSYVRSQVAANRWLDVLFLSFASALSGNGLNPFSFSRLKGQLFAENVKSLISFSNFLCDPANSHLIDSSFRSDFSAFLTVEIEERTKEKIPFPDANRSNKDLENYIDNVYSNLNLLPFGYRILKPVISKNFLISSMSKTYQSHTIISNYIKILIDFNEFDEAFAAFKTYVSYVEKDQEQRNGHVSDILAVIDTYTYFMLNMNPLKSLKTGAKGITKFKHTSEDLLLKLLSRTTEELQRYLSIVAEVADLSYDDNEFGRSPLSFLYHRYNVNLLLKDESFMVNLISKAWFSLGYYHYYLSIYKSTSENQMQENVNKVLLYYKNCLIVNSVGEVKFLFHYALSLAYDRDIKHAIKLCKFILRKYPESLKTWNLLALLLTAIEDTEQSNIKRPNNNPSAKDELNGTNGTKNTSNGTTVKPHGQQNDNTGATATLESEKVINNGLNVAGILLNRHKQHEIKLTFQSKYEIMQLKMTQLAIQELLYGIQHVSASLSDIFKLFNELFDIPIDQEPSTGVAGTNDTWSHRPTVLDSNSKANGNASNGMSKEKQLARDKIKRLSRTHKSERRTSVQTVTSSKSKLDAQSERNVLQEVWLWTSGIYLKLNMLDEAEQCLVEAETVCEPNYKTFCGLGYLTSTNRKFLSLQEFEKSLEILQTDPTLYDQKEYAKTLLGLSKLFIVDDTLENSLFISSKDLNAGYVRLKNYLEKLSLSWPTGCNSSEVWWYLSKIYDYLDDKILMSKSLWKCIELEETRPVRNFDCCEEFIL